MPSACAVRDLEHHSPSSGGSAARKGSAIAGPCQVHGGRGIAGPNSWTEVLGLRRAGIDSETAEAIARDVPIALGRGRNGDAPQRGNGVHRLHGNESSQHARIGVVRGCQLCDESWHCRRARGPHRFQGVLSPRADRSLRMSQHARHCGRRRRRLWPELRTACPEPKEASPGPAAESRARRTSTAGATRFIARNAGIHASVPCRRNRCRNETRVSSERVGARAAIAARARPCAHSRRPTLFSRSCGLAGRRGTPLGR